MRFSATKFLAALFAAFLAIPFQTFAASGQAFSSASVTVTAVNSTPLSKYSKYDRKAVMTVKEFFTVVFDVIAEYEHVPKSSAYVQLKYTNVVP